MLVFCVVTVLMAAAPQPVFAQEQDIQELPTPPRIGMVSGTASFWRPGAENWSPAQINTALAAGDALYTADAATLEVQIGSRAYVRLAQNAMLTLLNDEPNLQQFKITSGIVAFDMRSFPTRHSIEIDTPSGAFNIDSAGYYRLEITDTTTHFVVRRGGEATVTLPDGDSRLIAPSQEAIIERGNVETYVAPDTDAWDQWNYARTDDLIDAISNRYVSPEVYGTDDLDHYGNWRVTPDYGPVWVPNGMAPDWAPYSSGSWVWDPVYAWTWVDTAPWGWAPYHYGRWININGFWAWAPGPRHHRPAYAPALVAFFHGSGGGLQISFGGPSVSWVALGWGEPCLPWWGQRGFVGRPWWGGWAGPRVVNNVVIQHNTVINNVTNIRYRNFDYRNAVIDVPEKSFGHGRVTDARRLEPAHVKELRPITGQWPMHPGAASFTPSTARSAMPAADIMNRPAVGLHTPHQRTQPWQAERNDRPQAQQQTPSGNVITVHPRQMGKQAPSARFGQSAGPERNEPRRAPEPPRVDRWSPPQMRQENTVIRPTVPVQIRPPEQQAPAGIMNPPQDRRHEHAPARIMNPPPQAPVIIQREAPRVETRPPPQMRRENTVIRPTVPVQIRPPEQQAPAGIINPPQDRRHEQEPARIMSPPPQAPVIMQREAPRMPVVAPPQAERPMPRQEQAPQNIRPEAAAPMPLREMRREHAERPRENRQQEAPEQLPGQPANRLYPGRFLRSEQQR